MSTIVRNALTSYGDFAGQSVRFTVAQLASGEYRLIRMDGTRAILPFLPNTVRTSGDVVSVAATMVDTFHMAEFPTAALPEHGTWKKALPFVEWLAKWDAPQAVIDGLIEAYG